MMEMKAGNKTERKFLNTEYGTIITEKELKEYWNEMPEWDKANFNNSFGQYLGAGMTHHGGVLEEI